MGDDCKELPCRRCGRVWKWAFDKKSEPYCPTGYGCATETETSVKEPAPYARIEMLEAENEKLRKALDIYQRERDRFKHAKPEITGEYFLAGGHGLKDDNLMPQFIEICPAYGCAWVKVYEDTGRTISYEGS